MMSASASSGVPVVASTTYDPPGSLSANGPRHDNDHAEIKDIQIVPTQAELTCQRPPFLPSNDVRNARHHLPIGWSQLLDTHFRLYREDMIDQIRKGVLIYLKALKTAPNHRSDLLNRSRLRQLVGQDVIANAYGNIEFLGINDKLPGTDKDSPRGTIQVSFDQPYKIRSTTLKKRKFFWKKSRRRLMPNSLVCFFYPACDVRNNKEFCVSLGVIHKYESRLFGLARDKTKATLCVTMINSVEYCRIILAVKNKNISPRDIFMVESTGDHFESYRPILQALQMIDPGSMPLGKYIAPKPHEGHVPRVNPPQYALAPGFEFNLSVLFKSTSNIRCRLNVKDSASRKQAESIIRSYTTMDDTQSQALVNSLCREVALISGPPGTGKTWIGVELMRVLIHNAKSMQCGPILCICYTDHALDQFLELLLHEGINKFSKLVRIGGQHSSKRVRDHNLYELVGKERWTPSESSAMKKANLDLETTAKNLQQADKDLRSSLSVANILKAVEIESVAQYEELKLGPSIMPAVSGQPMAIEDNYRLWYSCGDLDQAERENSNRRIEQKRLNRAGTSSNLVLLPIPRTKRTLLHLHRASLWTMSRQERKLLADFWICAANSKVSTRYEELTAEMKSCSKKVEDVYDLIRQRILARASVVCVTTYGAAKHQTLLTKLQPRIIMCEEAGEVLESHVLAALSKNTQHLILIGDHLQLRPKISTKELSCEWNRGRGYNLDRSLFERLITTARVPSSILKTQRRMRPEICDFVRHSLYPDLIDHEDVFNHPDVQGMATNVFFMDHLNTEDKRDDYFAMSVCNTFEADMVKALVKHLLANGHIPSKIAILAPYVRQLTLLRKKLSSLVDVEIDERDQEQLEDEEDEDDVDDVDENDDDDDDEDENKEHARVVSFVPGNAQGNSSRLTLRSIDNYQGEEADIVIISLVRSVCHPDEQLWSTPSIGFLKSPNRTNVLLSRAKYGMYLIGNAGLMQMPKNGIWPAVMKQLSDNDRIGRGFLLKCRNHPHAVIPPAINPAAIKMHMPNGSCRMPCEKQMPCLHTCPKECHLNDEDHYSTMRECQMPCATVMPCRHICPRECHYLDDDNHYSTMRKCQTPCATVMPCRHICPRECHLDDRHHGKAKDECQMPCIRQQSCGHVCDKKCNEDCGDCRFPVNPFNLHCGHLLENALCFQMTRPLLVQCKKRVKKRLPYCEHLAEMDCYDNGLNIWCEAKCKGTLECGHPCDKSCFECTGLSSKGRLVPHRMVTRTEHGRCQELCKKTLRCGHICYALCHLGSVCPPCKEICEISCPHVNCSHKCKTLCSACCKPCAWSCPHEEDCKLPCGVPCSRLPCNLRCQKMIECGHRCPSLCGEPCPLIEYCVECKSEPRIMEMIVDLPKNTPLSNVDVDVDPILVLPCGHAFTMSSLDDYMGMGDFYEGLKDMATNTTTFFKIKPLPSSQVRLIGCPTCGDSLGEIRRYGRCLRFSELFSRVGRFEQGQVNAIARADKLLSLTHSSLEIQLHEAVEKISRLVSTPVLEVLGKTLQRFWQSSSSSTSSLDVNAARSHTELVSLTSAGTLSEGSNVIVFPTSQYNIPKEQQWIWTKVMQPLWTHLQEFDQIYGNNARSPIQELTAHFLKSDESNRGQWEENTHACGLPPDGRTGSSFARTIQGRSNALILILYVAMQVLQTIRLKAYYDHPSVIGWSNFVEDLLQCCVTHCHIQCGTALEGKYHRLEMHAKLNLLIVHLLRMQWLGNPRHGMPHTTLQKLKQNREAAVHDTMTLFKATLEEIQDNPNFYSSQEPPLKAKIKEVEDQMYLARKIALGDITPPSEVNPQFKIFKAPLPDLSKAEHWYRCLNGHQFGVALVPQIAACPDCDKKQQL